VPYVIAAIKRALRLPLVLEACREKKLKHHAMIKGHRRVTEMTLNAFNALVELALAIELETDVVCGAPWLQDCRPSTNLRLRRW
jgi:hypothetical protein